MITAAELLAELQAAHKEHRRAAGRTGHTTNIIDPAQWLCRRKAEEQRACLLVAAYDTTHMCRKPEHANPRRHRYDIATTPRAD